MSTTLAKPTRTTYREIPVTSFNDWDTVDLVKQALTDLERGQFMRAAYLVDAMGRDDRIVGVLNSRISALASMPLKFEPPEQAAKTKAARVADAVKQLWPRMAPDPVAKRLHKYGLMIGYGLAQKVWSVVDGQWVPTLQPWHPSFMFWDWGSRSLKVITEQGTQEVPDGGNDQWFLYAPYGYYLGQFDAAVRALAILWLMRGWSSRDWARYDEVYGLGMIKAIVPAGANQSDGSKDRFVDGLANRGSEPVVECEQDAEGKGYDFELVEATSTGYETFKDHRADLDASIAIVLLGQNLTTEGGKGGGGAYALGQVHYEVKQEITKSDNASLGAAFRDQLLTDFARYNYGDGSLAPLPNRQVEPPADKDAEAGALQKLSAAVQTFKEAEAPVDQRALLEQQGVPLLTPEQEKQQKAEAADRAAQAQAAFEQRGAAEPDPEDPGQREQMSAREKLPAGSRRGQEYIDELAEKSAARAAETIATDLQGLLHEVELASTPADLRARLLRRYADMDFKALAALEEKSELLAELAGRRSVLEDIA